MIDQDLEAGGTLDLDRGLGGAAEGDRVVFGDAGALEKAAELDADGADADGIAADDELALGLAGQVGVAGEDVAKEAEAAFGKDAGEAAGGEGDLGLDVGEREDAGGVHQQEADAEELLEALDAPLDDDHAGEPGGIGDVNRRGDRGLEDDDINRARRAVAAPRVGDAVGLANDLRLYLGGGDRDVDRVRLSADRKDDLEDGDVEVLGVVEVDDAVGDELLDFNRVERTGGELGDDDVLQRDLGDLDVAADLLAVVAGGGDGEAVDAVAAQRDVVEGEATVGIGDERTGAGVAGDLDGGGGAGGGGGGDED